MRKIHGSLPLAFILAMAAEASGSPDTMGSTPRLDAGALRALLDAAIDTNIDAATGAAEQSGERWQPAGKTAQFFPNFPNFPNFFNCFNGTWRNC